MLEKFKNMDLKTKLISSFLMVGLIPVTIVGLITMQSAHVAILGEAYAKLHAVQQIKTSQIKNYFDERFGDAEVFANNPFIHQAYKEMIAAFNEAGGFRGEAFKGLTGEKYIAPGAFKAVHNRFFPVLKHYMEQYGYYDIFFMDPRFGDTFFTVTKEADFGQRVSTVESALQDVWKIAARKGKIALSDTKPYAPSNGVPAQFIAAPIKEQGEIIGVLAFQISVEAIDKIMDERAGMGKTGEVYLVGPDKLMRSDSHLDKERVKEEGGEPKYSVAASFAHNNKVDTEAVREGLAGKSGEKMILNYNDSHVLSAYSPVDLHGVKWVVIAEINEAEINEPMDAMLISALIIMAIAIGLIVVFAYFMARFLAKGVANAMAKSEALVKYNADAVFMTDENLVIQNINDNALKAMGYSRDEVVGKMTCADLCKTPVCNTDACTIKNCMKTKSDIVTTTIAKTKNGDIIPVRTACGVVLDADGNPAGGFEVISDIRLIDEGFMNNMADPAFRTDANLLIQNINDAALNALGYTKEEVIGKMTCADVCKTPVCNTNDCTIKRCIDTKGSVVAETVATAKDGTKIPVRAACGVLLDNNGNPSGGFEVISDNTDFMKMIDVTKKVADGDLTVVVDSKILERTGAVGNLGKAMDKMINDMKNLIGNLTDQAENLTQAVNEIASGNENLSQRTSEQASSLEEIASTIEQTTATIKQNAENAGNADRLSRDSKVLANDGSEVVDQAVGAINEINESSKKIGEIISVINEIAFQTNLLALNAAVEAARAGEQGRGFAVVAGEVRNLAQRSANAAKEIEGLIKDSLDKVERGTELSNKSGEALKEINKSIDEVGKIIQEVAAASDEQKQGINQINTAVTEMDSVTQQNASLVEETASASEEMANQAQELLAQVGSFKIDRKDGGVVKKKEIHIKTAEGKGGNGGKKNTEPEKTMIPPDAVKKDLMQDLMAEEGFEEF